MDTVTSFNQSASYPQRSFGIRPLIAYSLATIGFAGLFLGLADLLPGKGLIALIFAASVQALAVSSIKAAKTEFRKGEMRRWRTLSLCLATYAACAFLTLAFSYSSFFRWLQAEGSARRIMNETVITLMAKLDQIESKYSGLQTLFDDLATRSSVMNKEEKDRGNTCGFPSPVGDGWVARFRAREATDFAAQRDIVRRDVEKVREIAMDIRTKKLNTANVTTLGRAFESAATRINTALIDNASLESLAAFVENKKGPGARIEKLDRSCIDTLRTSQLDAAENAITGIRNTPRLARPELFDPTDTRMMVKRAFAFLLAAGAKLIRFQPGDIPDLESISRLPRDTRRGSLDALLPDDMWPLVIVLVLESLLFGLVPPKVPDVERQALVTRIVNRPWSLLDPRLLLYGVWLLLSGTERPAVDEVADSVEAQFQQHYLALTKLIRPFGRDWLAVIPLDRAHQFEIDLVHGLLAHGDSQLVHGNLLVERVPEQLRDLVDAVPDMAVGGDGRPRNGRIQLWRVSRRFANWARLEQIRNREAA